MDGDLDNTGSVGGFALAGSGSVSFVAGKFGMAASFGTGGFSRVLGIRNELGTYPRVTIAFWLKEPGTLNSVAVLDCNNRFTSPFGGIQLGFSTDRTSVCVSTTSNSFLSGSCNGFSAPSANTFHHWIIRYNGTGTGIGQGGPTEIYVDGNLVHTRPNDNANNPVFTTNGISDTLTVGAPGTLLDDVRVYDRVFTIDEQCTQIIGGRFVNGSCALPP